MASLLFICALIEEKNALTSTLGSDTKEHLISARLMIKVQQYRQDSLDIYVGQCGMGNVNAGITLALILEQLNIDQIVLIGVGGALHSKLNIGDMLISDRVIQHDYFASLEEGRYLMRPGDLILNAQQATDYEPIMRSAASHLNISAYKHPHISITQGLIASGSEFVGSLKRKNAIFDQCQHALLVDMEASAIASVANQFNTPFLIAKTVSDKLHSDGSISDDFLEFLDIASKNAAVIAQLIIIDMLDCAVLFK